MVGLAPYGKTPHQVGALAMWARRRDVYGPSGFSPSGLHQMRLNKVAADLATAKRARSKRCHLGHLYASGTLRHNRCNSCQRLRYHAKRIAAIETQRLASLKTAMVQAHPDRGGSTVKFLKARALYMRAKAA